MTICYLDPEDEITGAVARIRAVEDGEAVVVLPPGSRIATSRINFRLLAREAEEKGLNLVAVSDEPGVRALAISAGVPAYDSVAGAEAGLREFARQDRRLAERIAAPDLTAGEARSSTTSPTSLAATERAPAPGSASPRRMRDIDATRVMAAAGPTAVSAGEASERLPTPIGRRPPAGDDVLVEDDEPYYRRRRRRRSVLGPLLAIGLALLLIGVAAYGAYLFLPTAEIVLRPQLTAVGPVSGTVIADPRVAVIDPGEGVVPAQQLELPLSASGEFSATGARVTTTRASGTVRFRSTNTASEVVIPAGTRVATPNGVAFATTAEVTVPRAVFDTGTPGEIDARVRAVRAGPRGNVAAGAISVVPKSLTEQLVSVTNPQPISGGERRQAQIVTQEDYDAAVARLSEQLTARLQAVLADPATTPRGMTLYPASAQLGRPTSDPPPSEIVDQPAESFELTVNASATVIAVNESLVEQVVLEQLRALVPPGTTLLAETVETSHTPGEFGRGTVVFTASANGQAYRAPDRDALLAEVRGRPVDEARAIMDKYGTAELTVWPDFVDRVPDQPARINLTIVPPTESP